MPDYSFSSGAKIADKLRNDIKLLMLYHDLGKTKVWNNDENIPVWVRNNASWWALDKISEEDFRHLSGFSKKISMTIAKARDWMQDIQYENGAPKKVVDTQPEAAMLSCDAS